MKKNLKTRLLRILSGTLMAALLCGTLCLPTGAWGLPNQRLIRNYNDVTEDKWYYDAVSWVVSNKLMSDLGDKRKFEPETSVTRAMFCKMCMNFVSALEMNPQSSGKTTFLDVPADSWFFESVSWAQENGIVGGYSETEFAPNDLITREQMAKLLYNFITVYFGVDVSGTAAELLQFTDKDTISTWATDAVSALLALGLFNGMNGVFSPQTGTTRAQVATLLERFYRFYANTYPCYIDEALVLTMEDEFDGVGKTGWREDVWYNVTDEFVDEHDGDGNLSRPADWQPTAQERCYTENGLLYMSASYPEKYEYYNNRNCIAGLFSNGAGGAKFSQSYGYYEIRMKPSDAAGFISTFWMTTTGSDHLYNPDADPLQQNPFVEMDVMETLPHVDGGDFFSTLHWTYQSNPEHYCSEQRYIRGSKMNRENENQKPYCVPDTSFFDGNFHTVGFLWTKDSYTIYYDGNYVGSYTEAPKTNGEAVLYLSCYFADDTWPNVNNACKREDFGEANRSSYIIDYVRVYQLREYIEEYAPQFLNVGK